MYIYYTCNCNVAYGKKLYFIKQLLNDHFCIPLPLLPPAPPAGGVFFIGVFGAVPQHPLEADYGDKSHFSQ